MFDPKTFHVTETLHDGSVIEIRALRPEDRKEILAAMEHASADTLYHRFFAVKRHFSEKEEHYFFDIDFVNHVVLIATTTLNGGPAKIVGGSRFVVTEPGKAEVAFSVVDEFQHHGLGAALMRHITAVAREAGIHEFSAEVLADNSSMLGVFEHSGLVTATRRDGSTVHVSMRFPDAPPATTGRVTSRT
jgi:GNAT superfamily N-acetyltransferase